jgi:peptide-methionine (S)-S-oxide reductase
MVKKYKIAIFGGGCFWCTEAVFSNLKGVVSVMSGYSGGTKIDPNYQEVSTGNTGHAEVIKVEYDSDMISYVSLLDVFFHTHDPTTLNRQGNDVGPQYRSIILYVDNGQRMQAEDFIKKMTEEKEFSDPIVTEIKLFKIFYPAEAYHRHYYEGSSSNPYCQIAIAPKLSKFREKYKSLLKA